MNPDRFARLKELLQEAVDLSETEREAYLDAACRSDPELRREVESILAQEGHAPDILKSDPPPPTPESDPLIGKTVCHYQILKRIDEGGMGVVYKAEDTKLRRTVALKFLRRDMTGSGEVKSRFVHEARAAASLDHPNICTVYAIDECGDQTFIAMAFVEGESLKDKIAEGPLEPDKALDVAIQIAEGLKRAHSKGIVHRDIKPSNIMVTPEGRAKIMDFGLAKMPGLTQLTKTSTTLGTVAYMSPEQARGEAVDHRTDVWSLGVLLYEMVTGQLPFRSKHEQAVIYLILNEEPQSVTAIREDLPKDLERVVHMAMAKDANDRYQTIGDLLTDLCSLRDGLCPQIAAPIEAPDRKPSIAVLPFADLSPAKDQEYFCDGIAEELINALSRLEGLRVPARTSAFSFKGKDVDIAEIARKLRVSTVLEGSVRKAGNRLRIAAQLINVTDGYHLWSERYDREMEDIFDIQDEISLTIVEKLKPKLLKAEKEKLKKRHTVSPEAYDLYLMGRHIAQKHSKQSCETAVDYFEQSINCDPYFVLPYAGLADVYTMMGRNRYLLGSVAFVKARQNAIKALEIDDTVCEAHIAMGMLHVHQFEWDAAEEALKRAVRLNPSSALAHYSYSFMLQEVWRSDEAIAEAREALELEPLSVRSSWMLGVNLGRAGRNDEAIAQLKRTIQLDPGCLVAYTHIFKAYAMIGMYDKALEMIDIGASIDEPDTPLWIAWRGWVYNRAGRREEANQVLLELEKRNEQEEIFPYCLALIYAVCEKKDLAFEILEKLVKGSRDPESKWTISPAYLDDRFDQLRSDPRFGQLMREMGLKDWPV